MARNKFYKAIGKFLSRLTFRDNSEISSQIPLNDSRLSELWEYLNSSEMALNNYSAVYGVVNRKSNAMAQLPLKLYRKTTNGRKTIENEFSDLIVRPENNRSAFVFWRTISAMKEIHGNAYAFIERDQMGKVIQLKILDPKKVYPFENEKDNNELYYKVYSKQGYFLVHHLDILHFPSVYSSGYSGVSFLNCLTDTLKLNKINNLTAAAQSENSLKVSGVIKLSANLSKEKKQEYEQQFKDMYSNGWNSVLVLDLGTEYQPIKFDVQDLKLLESNKITVHQISMVSGVPLYMLAEMEGSKYNNVEQQGIDFIQSCISPDVNLIEQELNFKLLSATQRSKGYYFKFNINAILRADMKTRADFYSRMIPIAGLTINDIRDLEDMPSYGPIGDRPLVTLNTTFLDTLEDHERLKGGEDNDGKKESGDQSKQSGNGTKNFTDKES